MFDQEVTLTKEEIYYSLAVINDTLRLAVEHLEKLKTANVLPGHLTDINCALLRQKKSEISHQLAIRMSTCEMDDSFRFQQERIGLEKRLQEMDSQAAAPALQLVSSTE